jgi:hypothetical protein
MKKQPDPISAPETTPATSSITERIKPVAESTGPISVLFYGRSGTGKTVLASTFPKPLLLLDIGEHGTDSVSDVPGVDVLRVETWEDIEVIYWFIRAGKHSYKTLVLDTVTQMQKLAQEKILVDDGKEKTSSMNKNLWGQTSKLMTAWLINYRDLDINTVFLAQDRNTVEEGNPENDQVIQEVGPRVMPSIAGTLNAMVRVIGQTYIKVYRKSAKEGPEKTFSFRLRIGPNEYFLTKTRKIKGIEVPDSIHNPTFQKLMEAISPKVKTEETKTQIENL